MDPDRFILYVDVAGSNQRIRYDHPLLVELTQQMVGLLPADTRDYAIFGDSAFAMFREPAQVLAAVQDLAVWWRDYPDEVEPLPSGVALRGAVHFGPVGRLEADVGPLIGTALAVAAEVSTHSALDSYLLTSESRHQLSTLLKRKHLTLRDARQIRLRDGVTVNAYELPFSAVSQPPDRLIQLAAPTDLVLFLASQPEGLFRVAPRRFEEVMAELLSDLGYVVGLTKTTRDNGIDIIAIGRSAAGIQEKYLVQCKRYAPDNRVGVSVVRELLGVGVHEPNTGVIIATTSTFTGPARTLATQETVRWRLHLRDYADITHWLRAYAQRRGR